MAAVVVESFHDQMVVPVDDLVVEVGTFLVQRMDNVVAAVVAFLQGGGGGGIPPIGGPNRDGGGGGGIPGIPGGPGVLPGGGGGGGHIPVDGGGGGRGVIPGVGGIGGIGGGIGVTLGGGGGTGGYCPGYPFVGIPINGGGWYPGRPVACAAMAACTPGIASAAVPCRSPFESLLNAYETVIARLHKNCPFIASNAVSEASKEAKLMKANPFDVPESTSLIIFGTCKITPKALNVSYSNFSSTSGSKFPTKIKTRPQRFRTLRHTCDDCFCYTTLIDINIRRTETIQLMNYNILMKTYLNKISGVAKRSTPRTIEGVLSVGSFGSLSVQLLRLFCPSPRLVSNFCHTPIDKIRDILLSSLDIPIRLVPALKNTYPCSLVSDIDDKYGRVVSAYCTVRYEAPRRVEHLQGLLELPYEVVPFDLRFVSVDHTLFLLLIVGHYSVDWQGLRGHQRRFYRLHSLDPVRSFWAISNFQWKITKSIELIDFVSDWNICNEVIIIFCFTSLNVQLEKSLTGKTVVNSANLFTIRKTKTAGRWVHVDRKLFVLAQKWPEFHSWILHVH
ncbi:hypothetical protein GCK72_005123 [Caenorhabditis remanei]|uniref:Uncharacterized protein n=1 Tax=Caenorhabditis remanei TaxID=31234 RepID=A0A6A5HDZ8_CAERE|nr:hypothetical protein GCK72_005123 [Caenorhabditis remanei]KAF1765171.1 hypothetical protein GCK72_005123 [Caenorhabditis remanei]